MLREWKNVRQPTEEGPRRWFTDEDMDLIVWYDADRSTIRGFQLCYDKQSEQHALTWMRDGKYNHARVDDGEGRQGMGLKQTPILVEDGAFDPVELAERFDRQAQTVDPEIRSLVERRLRELSSQ